MNNPYLRIVFEIILVLVVTILLFKRCKSRNQGSTKFAIKVQVIIGIIYGIMAFMFTMLGFEIGGAIQSVRDSAPLVAGLFFGPVSGIIAGTIGAIHRFTLVNQALTRIACTIGTFVAGLIAAAIKKYILDGKTPTVLYTFFAGIVAEVTHLMIIFVTNSSDIPTVLPIMQICAQVMIPAVTVATTMPALYLFAENRIKNKWRRNSKLAIADQIQLGLLAAVIVALITTNVFVYSSQNKLAYTNAGNVMEQSLNDIKKDITKVDFENYSTEEKEQFLTNDISNWHVGTTGYLTIIRADGILVSSSDFYYYEPGDTIFNYLPDLFDTPEYKVQVDYTDGDNYYMYSKLTDEFYVLAVYPSTEANMNRDFSIVVTAFMEIIILALLFFLVYLLIKGVVVNKIGKINQGLAMISSGNLDTVVDVRSNEEFDTLSDDINTTVDTLKRYIDEASARLDAELKFAQEIQTSALPSTFPSSDYYDIYATMIAAKQVGGDFYDFYRVDDDRIAFLVADVSGKGVPAALFMMRAKTLIKGLVESGCSPADTFTKANYELCINNEVELFVTAWLGVLNIKTGLLTYANAGHNPPILGKQDASAKYLDQIPGFVLGGIAGIHYKDFELKLLEGEGIFLYTDGVTEATNTNNEMYGEDRLAKVLNDVTAVNMRYLTKVIKDDIDEFVGEAPQFDDITMLGIRMKAAKEKNTLIELDPRDPNSTQELNDNLDRLSAELGLPVRTRSKMMIIFDEIYSNIVNYSRAKTARVRVLTRNGLLSLAFADDGIYYNPLDKEDPDITLSAEEREMGGLGVFMTKKMSEDIKYTRQGGFNILDVVIKIEK